jgi:hypothetical protein
MIAILSGLAGVEATITLQRLASNADLVAWHDQLNHSLQDHLRKERESGFVPSSIAHVGRALSNGQPANSADLRALVCAELKLIGEKLRRGATGGYIRFWNTAVRGKPISPKGEDECRDVLVDHLRIRLGRFGLRVEPEARYAESKRADIKILSTSCAVPIEAKRHMNRELWSAPVEQLSGRYLGDPEAQGHGIYLVFYYGSGKGIQELPSPPKPLPRPRNAGQLEKTLKVLLPPELHHSLDIVVLDISRSTR